MKVFRFAAFCCAFATLSISGAQAQAAAAKNACRICEVPSVGMERADVEEKVAAITGKESDFSPYRSDLKGGVVVYRDGAWTMRVTYQSGSPAPWVINAQGVGEHLQGIPEKVLKFEFAKARFARGR